MRVHISNNWTNNDGWWVYKLIKSYYNGACQLTSDPINCDIFLYSVFGNEEYYKTTKAKYKIFCSWETRFYIDITKERMPYADLTLTYMPTEGKNFRSPLWYQWIDWWNEQNTSKVTLVCSQSHHYIGNNTLPKDYVPTLENIKTNLYSPESIVNRQHFCAMLVGNQEPECIKPRKEIFDELNKIEPVNGFGTAFNNRVEVNKIELLTKFKYNCCFENSSHLGYCTEKLFDAKFAGTVPIYWGDPEYSKIDFNEKCFRNKADYSSMDEYMAEIRNIYNDKNYFMDIVSEPLFREEQYPSLDSHYEKLHEVLK